LNLRGSPLTKNDLAKLAERWIDPDTASRSLFRHVTSEEGATSVGRNGSGDYEGILIHFTWPGEDQVRGYRLRRSRPPVDSESGRDKEKYLTAPGDANKLFIPYGIQPEDLSSRTLSILIVEGEFKATALYRLAQYGLGEAAEQPRFLPIGL